MEQIKKLEWSWVKNDEDKQQSLRMFDFGTIDKHNILARTINEIHKSVLPEDAKHGPFRTSEEIKISLRQFNDEKFIELKDPRSIKTRSFKPSSELIMDYGYSSKLTTTEQKLLLNALNLRIVHNPNLLKHEINQYQRNRQQFVSSTFDEKHKNEAVYFNKCTEIFYHRNSESISLSDEMKSYLISRWSSLVSNENEEFKMITSILRDQICEDGTSLELQNSHQSNFNPEAYLVSKEYFPFLGRFSCDDLKFFHNVKSTDTFEETLDCDIVISLDLLAKFVAREEQFAVIVENHSNNSIGSMCTTFKDPLPLKQTSASKALEEIINDYLSLSIDCFNMDNLMAKSTVELRYYRLDNVDEFLRKMYVKFFKKAGQNKTQRVWNVTHGVQSFKVFVYQQSYFVKSEGNALVPANISIKLEYQTKFGAERMTRDELLKEWTKQKFNPQSATIRFRIDAVTLTILSISYISTEEIEKDLNEFYDINPEGLSIFGNLAIVFGCFKRLPLGRYNIQTKIDDSCSKLLVYKSSKNKTSLNDETWQISDLSCPKWMPICVYTPTFLHQNHQFAPCCFPHVEGKRQLSYTNEIRNDKIEQTQKTKKRKRVNKKRINI